MKKKQQKSVLAYRFGILHLNLFNVFIYCLSLFNLLAQHIALVLDSLPFCLSGAAK